MLQLYADLFKISKGMGQIFIHGSQQFKSNDFFKNKGSFLWLLYVAYGYKEWFFNLQSLHGLHLSSKHFLHGSFKVSNFL